jgi:multidrug efflux system outer membrane protein
MRSALSVGLGVVLFAVAACDPVGPNYVRPQTEVPAQFAGEGPWKQAVPQDSIARGDWWSVFNDPLLNRLEADAVRQNPDLKAAAARVLQSQAAAGIANSYRYPAVNAGGVGSYFANNPNFATLISPADISANNPIMTGAYKTVPLYATYEVDFWGRVRRQSEGAAAELGSSIAAYQTAMLTLNGDVAQTYFDIRTTDELIRIVNRNIELHRGTVDLIRSRKTDGLSNDMALYDVETSLHSTQAQAQTLAAQRVRLVNRLAVLTGTMPESFSLDQQPLDRTVPALPVGLPSDLMQRRPDIARAERDIAAYNAQIGVAVAAYFPSFTLISSVGFDSYSLSTLLNPTSNVWGVATTLFQQIFNAGRVGLNVERARAAYDERVALYKAVLLKAFEEVETALATLSFLEGQIRYQDQAVVSADRASTIASQRFTQGLVSMLDVLSAQRTALAARSAAVQVVNDQLLTTVALIKALGGGWQDRAQQVPEGSKSMWAPALK